jgi:ankyrin repeat protein
LEDNLQQLSYTLQPFSEVEQVEFLKKPWIQHLDSEAAVHDRLKIYAKELIKKLAQSISDKDSEFTGIPLQTRMLAEAFEKDFRSFYLSEKSQPELPHKLDLLGLYGRFIDSKYDILFKEKSKFQLGNIGADGIRERDSKNIQVVHQLLVLEALFTEEQGVLMQILPHSAFSDEGLARIGIAQRNNQGEPNFIHRTFAEYFVGDFLINQMINKTKQHVQVNERLLNEVLLREECHVIRAFLNGLLEKSKPSKEALKLYEEQLDEQWKQVIAQGSLLGVTKAVHEAAKEGNVCIIGILLDSLKSGKSLSAVTKLLLAKDHKGKTAWQLAAEEGHFEVLTKLWYWMKELQLKPKEIRKEVLLSKDYFGQRVWHKAARGGQVEILEKLWVWTKELQLKPEEIRNELLLSKDCSKETAWHKAAERGQDKILEQLWDWAKELQLKPEEIRNELLLSKDCSKKTAWHKAAEKGHIKILKRLWDWAKKLQLTPQELRNEVLMSKDKFGQTAWHNAEERGQVEILEKLWDWAKELQLKPEQLIN